MRDGASSLRRLVESLVAAVEPFQLKRLQWESGSLVSRVCGEEELEMARGEMVEMKL